MKLLFVTGSYSQVTPTPPPNCPPDGKFEYDAFEKMVIEIKNNCQINLLPKYELKVSECRGEINKIECLFKIVLEAFLDSHPAVALTDEEKSYLINNKDILCELYNINFFFPLMDLDYVINVLYNNYGGVTLEDFKATYEDFLDLNNPIDGTATQEIQNGIEIIISAVPSTDPIGTLIAKNIYRHPLPSQDMSTDGPLAGVGVLNPSDETLRFALMKNLFSLTTILNFKLDDVADEFVQRFKDNIGGSHFSDALSNNISTSPELRNFIKNFGKKLNEELKVYNGDINIVPVIEMGLTRPTFNGLFNRFHGLQILINDTEQTKVYKLNDYSFDPSTKIWQCSFYFEVIDHFGIDYPDVIKYQNKHLGFAAWYRLQHQNDHLPFINKMKVIATIKGKIN